MLFKSFKHSVAISIITVLLIVTSLVFSLAAQAGPASNNYELKEYGIGSGGTAKSDSTNYSVSGNSGEVESGNSSSTNYSIGQGLTYTIQSNVPPSPTFTNPSTYYNKLFLTIANGGNPTDTLFAVAISTDNFVSDTKYVQSDMTVGSVLGTEDWLTYSGWGSGSGTTIIGLSPGVTYTVKVSAKQGNFTQTQFGPTAQAATTTSSLTFDIDVSPTDSETSAPFSVPIGNLTAATVVTAPDKVWVDIDTNGTGGGAVYVYDSNSGLNSPRAGYTISATSTDLSSATEGYGLRGSSVAQSSGGPMQILSPYNGASTSVGTVDTTKRLIFDSSSQTVSSGRASFELKAKASAVTPAASDYTDTLTIIASTTF